MHIPSPLPSPGDSALLGHWAVVTGGTRGIGLEVARGLVTRGVQVLIIGRDRTTGEAATADLNRDAAGGAGVAFLAADFGRMQDVLDLARRITAAAPRVDLLIHNAAVVTPRRIVTTDGFEMQFAVNHLAPYLLSRELIPLLRAANEARIVVTASQVERGAILDLDDIMGSRDYHPSRAYGQSKLANVLFTYELAERLRGTNVTVNCLHPGVVRTRLLDALAGAQDDSAPKPNALGSILRTIRGQVGSRLRAAGLRAPIQDWALPTSAGALTTLRLALAPELRGVSGRYFADCEEAESSPRSHDVALRRALWDVSARLLGVPAEWPDWMQAFNPGRLP